MLFFSVFNFAPIVLADEDEETDQTSEKIQEQIEENKKILEEKEKELESLNEKIRVLREKRELKEAEAETIQSRILKLSLEIEELTLTIEKTSVLITRTNIDIEDTEAGIRKANEKLWQLKRTLQELFEMMYDYQNISRFEVIFLSDSVSEILSKMEYADTLQGRVGETIRQIEATKKDLEEKKIALDAKKNDLGKLQQTQKYQQDILEKEEKHKGELLKQNIGKQTEYTALIAEALEAKEEIGRAVFRLQNSNITLALSEAKDYAWYAENLTGVRAALLLAVLKIESNIGGNTGTGRYPDDMRPGDREAFLKICEELGLDPEETPVSARPRSYQGWGGAMGPAQIMPTTWLKYKDEVAKLSGKKTASPWNMRDAFLASAVILKNYGAKGDEDNEYEAVNRYFAGSNWQEFTWYGDRVMAVAKEYEKVM